MSKAKKKIAPKKIPKKWLNFALSADLHDRLKAKAERKEVSMSSLVRSVLKEYVAA